MVTKALFRRWQWYLVPWFYSSAEFVFPVRDARGKKQFEINVRLVMAFREIEKGNELMHTFTTMMNMSTLSHQSHNDIH